MSENRRLLGDWLSVSLLTVVASGLTGMLQRLQPRVRVNGGLGWDGVEYAAIFRSVHLSESNAAAFPFC
jgi:hypothetical protein